jgi:hypothetical protein
MTYKYMSADAPLAFPASTPLASTVYLNTDKTRFKLLRAPSIAELKAGIEEYATKRGAILWRELTKIEGEKCRLFAYVGNTFNNVNKATVTDLLGAETARQALRQELRGAALNDAIAKLEPKGWAEMEALYRLKRDTECAIGRDYFLDITAGSSTAFDFFGRLIDDLFNSTAGLDPTVGSLKKAYYQPRTYELLGFCVAKGWLLFPFVHSGSGIREHLHLSHRDNIRCSFADEYRPSGVDQLLVDISSMKVAKSTDIGRQHHLRNLILASSLRAVEQVTTELLQACIDLSRQANAPMTVQETGKLRKTYNGLLRLHNSRCSTAPVQAVLTNPREAVSVDDFASFDDVRKSTPQLSTWCDWFELFVRETKDTQGQIRKTACAEFAGFLSSLSTPPDSPLEITRAHINDYGVGNAACYRGYLAQKLSSAAARNGRLQMLGQFFAFVKERLVAAHKGDPQDAPWFAQPVDLKFDKFSDTLRSGTTRKAIAAHVMEEMRQVLTENDYAWSKTQGSWAHLANEQTMNLEHVWCPSPTILLYTLLTLPLRSLQARLFDSGEGDTRIFDFDKCVMVPNPKQIPIDGAIDQGRMEGVFQVIPSGMLDVVDIVGVWVPVNKTSDRGYHIPWVSDDFLRHMRYQYEWVRRYAANPNAHGIIEVQGHRNHPDEWVQRQSKFFCLFRDPTAPDRVYDPSLPVSKQKLLKLWVGLCAETERRINSRATTESQRVKLVKPGADGKLRAIHDIHTLRVSGITDLLDRGVPLNIVSEYVAGHATYIMTLWYDKPSPGKIRQTLKECEAAAGGARASIPKFTDEEVDAMRPYLVTNSSYEGMYTGFDALSENAGLLQFRLAGICPGTRCEEGGITSNGRITAVPVGDRGPSCPQCRFFLTGPAFLLGQCIEGNQLILKIRKKVQALDTLRSSILELEDAQDFGQADVLRAQTDVEERHLNDMLTEWWHRMKLYEASVHKLEDYRRFLREKQPGDGHLMLVADTPSDDLSFSFKQSTELELRHFLSTCAELLPNYAQESKAVALDLEMAVGKFLAINDHKDLTSMYFTLTDEQRLTAANLAVELLLGSAEDPSKAADLLEGRTPLKSLPNLQKSLADMLMASSQAARRKAIKIVPVEALK